MTLGHRLGREQVLRGVDDAHSVRSASLGVVRRAEGTTRPPTGRLQTPERSASRSRSRSTRRKRLVADDAVVAQPDDGVALGLDDRQPDRLVVEPLAVGLVEVAVAVGPRVVRLVLEPGPELVDQRQVVGVLDGEVLEPVEGGVDRRLARERLLALEPVPGHEPEPADDPRQGQALADERREDHAERQVDDQVALGERRRRERQRERRRERDGAAHARPRR